MIYNEEGEFCKKTHSSYFQYMPILKMLNSKFYKGMQKK